RANADHAAASTMSAPPAQMRAVIVDAPSATDETLAKSTSDSMITEVTLAASRAAPYCRQMFANTKPAPSTAAQPHHPVSPRPVDGIAPSALPTHAVAPAITAQPPNIASARAAPGASRRRRSRMFVTAKPKPAATPSQSVRLDGTGQSVSG